MTQKELVLAQAIALAKVAGAIHDPSLEKIAIVHVTALSHDSEMRPIVLARLEEASESPTCSEEDIRYVFALLYAYNHFSQREGGTKKDALGTVLTNLVVFTNSEYFRGKIGLTVPVDFAFDSAITSDNVLLVFGMAGIAEEIEGFPE